MNEDIKNNEKLLKYKEEHKYKFFIFKHSLFVAKVFIFMLILFDAYILFGLSNG